VNVIPHAVHTELKHSFCLQQGTFEVAACGLSLTANSSSQWHSSPPTIAPQSSASTSASPAVLSFFTSVLTVVTSSLSVSTLTPTNAVASVISLFTLMSSSVHVDGNRTSSTESASVFTLILSSPLRGNNKYFPLHGNNKYFPLRSNNLPHCQFQL
jgi:hypothetical protein